MAQPKTLQLPPAYRGNAYETSIPLEGYAEPPVVTAVLRDGRTKNPLAETFQPGALTMTPKAGNPLHWNAHLRVPNTQALPVRVWVEIKIGCQVYAAGYLAITYQL